MKSRIGKTSNNRNLRLSKSTLVLGIQCPKALWLKLHSKDLEAPVDAATQWQFDEGHAVGIAAQKEFPDGQLVDVEYFEIDATLSETKAMMTKNVKTIFEGSIASNDLYIRADILKKGKKGWHLIEVKKGTTAKPEYIQDVAIQAYVLDSAGIKLESISLMVINNKCVFPDLTNLFKTEDVSGQVHDLQKDIEKKIEELRKVAAQKSEPKIKVGPHCDEPYECAFKEYCWKNIAIPATRGTSAKAKVNKQAVKTALSDWEYPLYFFDFETLGYAIPRFDGTSPYNQVPFQFSCHVQAKPGAKLTHFEYLHKDTTDPRPGLIKAMLDGLGTKGSIVSYYMSFEKTVIKKLAEFDKRNATKLLSLIDRFVDPYPLIKKAVEHPDFVNGHSIKVVAPALLGEKFNYDNINIRGGTAAQAIAIQFMNGGIDDKDKKKVEANLLEYCRLDTMAMVELVNWLNKSE